MDKKIKQGRPEGIKFGVQKLVKITEEQNDNWNRNTPKAIRDLLDGKLVSIELLKNLYDFMSDESKCSILKFEENDLELIKRIKELVK